MIHIHERESTMSQAVLSATDDSWRQLAAGRSGPNPVAELHEIVQNLSDTSRSLLGAHQALARLILHDSGARVIQAVSLSNKYVPGETHEMSGTEADLDEIVCRTNLPLRFTQEELRGRPACKVFDNQTKTFLPMQGWLAVPLIDSAGRNIGLIRLADKGQGEFGVADEALLQQLARLGAAALENAWLHQAAQLVNDSLLHRLRSAMLQTEISESFVKHGDLPNSLGACAERLANHLDAACLHIWVVQGETLELLAQAGLCQPLERSHCRIQLGEFNVGRIASSRRPYLTNAWLDDPNIYNLAWAQCEKLQTFAGYPLLAGDSLEGVIALYARKPLSSRALDTLADAARLLAQGVLRQRSTQDSDYRSQISDSNPASGNMDAPHAIFTTTLEGVILDWNDGAGQIFGYSRTEMVNRPGTLLIPSDALEEQRTLLERIKRGEEVFRAEAVRLNHRGQRILVRLTAAPLRDRDGNPVGIVHVMHDMTRVKRLEQQYQQTQKMETFSRLTRGIAHDFNNLLTVVQGNSEVIITQYDPAEPIRGMLREIHKAGQRAEILTRQLSAFHHPQPPELKVQDLDEVVSDTVKMLRRLIGEDILLTAIVSPRLWSVKVDAAQMQQVILNLALNARDAMPKGGQLIIETANVTLDEASAQSYPEVRAGNYVKLAISDTGIGMSDVTKARIFEPLFTTKEPGKAAGLGLSTVRSLLKQNGGSIHVASEVGQGSTFMMLLPQFQESLPLGKPHMETRIWPRGNETILLVEDENIVRQLAKHVLQTCGYTVLEAMDGEEACFAASEHTQTIQLLITDVIMPRMGGRALAECLQAKNPHLKVLFVSGYTSDIVEEHGILEPEFAFLQKPFKPHVLAQTVRAILDRGRG